jgi:uracil-DNA glycosylase
MSLDLDTRQRAMLKEMGVKVWWPASVEAAATAPAPSVSPAAVRPKLATHSEAVNPIQTSRKGGLEARVFQAVDAGHISTLDWGALQEAVSSCQACALCQSRKKAVFGVGGARGAVADAATTAPTVDWLIVGEAPSEAEEAAGQPFVDAAGQLLDNMLKAVGSGRASGAFITGITKCRPPNRNPDPAEIAQCAPYLQRQIALLRPRVIIAMGRFAVQSLLADSVPDVASVPLGKLRGQVYAYHGVPVVATYHPAYLLRALADKGKAWEDLCLAMGQIQ